MMIVRAPWNGKTAIADHHAVYVEFLLVACGFGKLSSVRDQPELYGAQFIDL